MRPISGYADGTKNISNSGAFSNPNWNGYWDSGQPDGNGYAVQYWRRGSAPRMDDLEANRERQAYAMETYGYHGLQNAYAILETEIPDNIALTAYNGTFAASDTAQQLGAIIDMPFERAPNLANGWTPIGESMTHWYYVSSASYNYENAEIAASRVGGTFDEVGHGCPNCPEALGRHRLDWHVARHFQRHL